MLEYKFNLDSEFTPVKTFRRETKLLRNTSIHEPTVLNEIGPTCQQKSGRESDFRIGRYSFFDRARRKMVCKETCKENHLQSGAGGR